MPIYVGTQKIDVSGMDKIYVGTQLVYQKNTPNILDSITLSGQTTSLNRGASFSFGGTVTAHYTNGNTANVTSSTTFSGYNMSTAGTYTVTASYTEDGITKTATYQLTVNKAWTTIWSGNKSLTWANNTYTSATKPSAVSIGTFATLKTMLTTAHNIRITFSMNTAWGDGNANSKPGYIINSTNTLARTTTSKPSSPYTINNFSCDNSTTKTLIGQLNWAYRGGGNYNRSICLRYKGNDGSLSIAPFGDYIQLSTTGTALKLTVTKFEVYY